MITFNTDKQDLCNYVIHHFLEIEVFEREDGLEDIIDVLPEYLVREQRQKCKQTFQELYKWTGDKFDHDVNAFHEISLYYFLLYMEELQEEFDNFKSLYFDNKALKLIKEASIKAFEEDSEYTLQWYREFYGEVDYYIESALEDTDFLELENLYNELSMGSTRVADQLGINIDYYFELLPMDIQKKYKTAHINISGEVTEFLNFIQDRTQYGSLTKMFWKNKSPIESNDIQLLLDNLISSYYHNHEIQLLWSSKIQRNIIDFEIYQPRNIEEKVLLEFRRAGDYLKQGFEEYLLHHDKQYKIKDYTIICFTDEEYECTLNFIRNYVYTDTFRLYVNINVLDVRGKASASKITKGRDRND